MDANGNETRRPGKTAALATGAAALGALGHAAYAHGVTLADVWALIDRAAYAVAQVEHWYVIMGLCGAAWWSRARRQRQEVEGAGKRLADLEARLESWGRQERESRERRSAEFRALAAQAAATLGAEPHDEHDEPDPPALTLAEIPDRKLELILRIDPDPDDGDA